MFNCSTTPEFSLFVCLLLVKFKYLWRWLPVEKRSDPGKSLSHGQEGLQNPSMSAGLVGKELKFILCWPSLQRTRV